MCEKRSGPGRNRPKSANNNRKEHRSVAGHVTTSSVNTFAVYQPQVDNWHADLANTYCGVELKTGKQTASNYRVHWIQARNEVDQETRLVEFDQLEAAPEPGNQAAN